MSLRTTIIIILALLCPFCYPTRTRLGPGVWRAAIASWLKIRCHQTQQKAARFSILMRRARRENIDRYLDRIQFYTRCSDDRFLLGALYLARYLHFSPRVIQLNYQNVNQLFGASMLLAFKGSEDMYYTNTYYASVFTMTLQGIIHDL